MFVQLLWKNKFTISKKIVEFQRIVYKAVGACISNFQPIRKFSTPLCAFAVHKKYQHYAACNINICTITSKARDPLLLRNQLPMKARREQRAFIMYMVYEPSCGSKVSVGVEDGW